MTRLIATFGYVGLIPGPAGTWGSLAALATGYLLHRLGGFPLPRRGDAWWPRPRHAAATRVETFERTTSTPPTSSSTRWSASGSR